MGLPDERGDPTTQCRLLGRLQQQITSQAPMAHAGSQSELVKNLAELLIIVIAVDEQTAVRR
jgi:hypothetical protein